jgi:hypothetical protein
VCAQVTLTKTGLSAIRTFSLLGVNINHIENLFQNLLRFYL